MQPDFTGRRSGYEDDFARRMLPPAEAWPTIDCRDVPPAPEFDAAVLNCAAVILDGAVTKGWGSRPAVHYGDTTWSYSRLLDQANRIAEVLVADHGLRPGNRVLIRGHNTPMLVACWFAVLKAGGICVTTMPMLRARELGVILERAQVDIALCESGLVEELAVAFAGAPGCRALHEYTPLGDSPRAASLDFRLPGCTGSFAPCATAGDDVALIAFTSGTTGRPKATMHLHRDVVAVTECFPRHLRLNRPDAVCLGTPPLAFTFGLGAGVLFPMRVGASTRFLTGRAAVEDLLECIAGTDVDTLYTAPTMYRQLAAAGAGGTLRRLHTCVSAGEVLQAATWEGFRDASGIRILDCLGTTELLHGFIGAPAEAMRPGYIGTQAPGYRVQIVDAEGRPCAPGQEGLLRVRGPTGCRYLDDPVRQAEYVRSGWNYTGDVCRQDEDGYIAYVARADDMIISAGYNISGPEVENVLRLYPGVADCAVVGIPDPARGAIVQAFVVLTQGLTPSDELARSLQDFTKRNMAPYKYPRAIKFVDDLPRTATGKLQRAQLRGQ